MIREINLSWEYQQQLIGDQASLDYVLSCSNRIHNSSNTTNNNDDLNSILTRTAHIPQVYFSFCIDLKNIIEFV
jgi:hypothetical protein